MSRLHRLWKRLCQLGRGLRAGWRLAHGYCPACNSDAPQFNRCQVCQGYDNGRDYSAPYPPTRGRKARWEARWMHLETHGPEGCKGDPQAIPSLDCPVCRQTPGDVAICSINGHLSRQEWAPRGKVRVREV